MKSSLASNLVRIEVNHLAKIPWGVTLISEFDNSVEDYFTPSCAKADERLL